MELSESQKKINIDKIVSELEKIYPAAECSLRYQGEAWKLLVMARLSAQCTDARVNIVSEELFEKLPTLKDMADAPLELIEQLIKPCGLYKSKAKNIKDACNMLIDDFGGNVPSEIEQLLKLPGVGRKIANLILGDLFDKPAIVADTHCIRLCGRFGMYDESQKSPEKTEKIMSALVEPSKQADFCHRLVMFGRDVCTARSPKCGECPINSLCAHNIK